MRIIGHLDMDAFFAAIEERDNPRWRGFPIVIGADPQKGSGRGVVSTANYKAREYGIHSAMPISQAWELSQLAEMQSKPPTIFLEPNMARYAEVSQSIMEIVRERAPQIQQTSVDEAHFDLSFTDSYKKAAKICGQIKKEIKEKEKLTCSIGLGPNKLIAKIASDFQKPNGLTIVEEKDAETFLEPMPIRKIPGIGPKTEIIFKNLGAQIVKDLKKFSEARLVDMLGKWGLELYEKIRGRDDSPIISEEEIKSIGEQETFVKDTLAANHIFERLQNLAKSVIERLAKDGFKNFRTIVVIVRFADFETKSRSRTLEKPTSHLSILQFEALKLLTPFLDKRSNPRQKLIRLIGLRVEKLST